MTATIGNIVVKTSDVNELEFLTYLIHDIATKYKLRLTTTFINEIRVMDEKEFKKIRTYADHEYNPNTLGYFMQPNFKSKMIVFTRTHFDMNNKNKLIYTFIHEYAHAVDSHYDNVISKEIFIKFFDDRAIRFIGKSSYGLTNEIEFMAEVLTNYIINRNRIEVSDEPEFENLVQFVLKKYFKLNY